MTYLSKISVNILHQLPLTYVATICQLLTEIVHLLCTSMLGKNVLLFCHWAIFLIFCACVHYTYFSHISVFENIKITHAALFVFKNYIIFQHTF